jgi:thiol-disulfide isomerase/thioredoxin
MKRRLVLAGGAVVVLGGGVVAQRAAEKRRLDEQAAVDRDTAGFWTLAFPTPDETAPRTLAMASFRGEPLLLNFWGTWCPPCVKEMPELDRFARDHAAQGWRVLGLAVDNARAVREFLRRTPVSYAIAMAGFEGSELARRLGNTQSGLPFTVAFDRRGRVAKLKAGETNAAEMAAWAREMAASGLV